jgi:hypothetical protein
MVATLRCALEHENECAIDGPVPLGEILPLVLQRRGVLNLDEPKVRRLLLNEAPPNAPTWESLAFPIENYPSLF